MKSIVLALLAVMIGLGSVGAAQARNRYTATQGWNRPHWHHGWHRHGWHRHGWHRHGWHRHGWHHRHW